MLTGKDALDLIRLAETEVKRTDARSAVGKQKTDCLNNIIRVLEEELDNVELGDC